MRISGLGNVRTEEKRVTVQRIYISTRQDIFEGKKGRRWGSEFQRDLNPTLASNLSMDIVSW